MTSGGFYIGFWRAYDKIPLFRGPTEASGLNKADGDDMRSTKKNLARCCELSELLRTRVKTQMVLAVGSITSCTRAPKTRSFTSNMNTQQYLTTWAPSDYTDTFRKVFGTLQNLSELERCSISTDNSMDSTRAPHQVDCHGCCVRTGLSTSRGRLKAMELLLKVTVEVEEPKKTTTARRSTPWRKCHSSTLPCSEKLTLMWVNSDSNRFHLWPRKPYRPWVDGFSGCLERTFNPVKDAKRDSKNS